MRNRFILAALACLGVAACSDNAVKPAIPADPEIEKAVEKTLAGMTLEEKVGQMTEIAIDVVGGWGPEAVARLLMGVFREQSGRPPPAVLVRVPQGLQKVASGVSFSVNLGALVRILAVFLDGLAFCVQHAS